jgi:phosphatidylserine decarboxylase
MTPSVPRYIDRRTGQLKRDAIYAQRLLDWLYNSASGWMLTNFLFSKRFISQLYGWVNKTRWSRRKIPSFVASMGVDMAESPRSIEEFKSFNDFITREIDLSKRPIDADSDVCVAPADGRVLAYPLIDRSMSFHLKRACFTLETLLRNERLARSYENGALVISRLYLADYHHFHFPDAGVPHEEAAIPGRYYAVTPYSPRRVPYFAENHRVMTRFESDHFGQIVMIEVGAFAVGSIRQRFRPDRRVAKGDHKGFFELGGSVIALLFREGTIELDRDLCEHTREGVETYVRLGESIGRIPA